MNCVNCKLKKSDTNHRHLCKSCNTLYESGKRHGGIEFLKRVNKSNNELIKELEMKE
jgi:hypothetical protein